MIHLGSCRKKENLLIIGSGGREHALGWKLGQRYEGEVGLFLSGQTAGLKITC